MTFSVNLFSSPYTWDLVRVIFFLWNLVKICAGPLTILVLNSSSTNAFSHPHFCKAERWTEILHSNHHISRYQGSYSSEALRVHYDIAGKWPLVNITNAFCRFPETCLVRTSLIFLYKNWYIIKHDKLKDRNNQALKIYCACECKKKKNDNNKLKWKSRLIL